MLDSRKTVLHNNYNSLRKWVLQVTSLPTGLGNLPATGQTAQAPEGRVGMKSQQQGLPLSFCPQSIPVPSVCLVLKQRLQGVSAKPLCKGPHVYSENHSLTRACQFITHASDVPGEQEGNSKCQNPARAEEPWSVTGKNCRYTRLHLLSEKQLEAWPCHKEMRWIRETHRSEV